MKRQRDWVSMAGLESKREGADISGLNAPLDQAPPQDLLAEQAVLGAMLHSKDAIADVLEGLRHDDFYRPDHEAIFETILDLFNKGEPVDPLTLGNEIERRGLIPSFDRNYLLDLFTSISVVANATSYAQIVHEKAILRRLLQAAIRITQLVYRGQGDVSQIVDEAQQIIYALTQNAAKADNFKPLSELVQQTIDAIELLGKDIHGQGVRTGFQAYDELTNGLQAGQMIIIAARPGIGKSTLALDFARSAAIQQGLTTAFFSLEMSQVEIVMKILSAHTSVPLAKIRSGQLTDEDWAVIVRSIDDIGSAPLYIDDSPNMTMMEIRAKARRLKQNNDLHLIVIDYMQLISSGKKVESRQLEVSEFSRQIKLLAKELEVPVVVLSQLNRGPEQREDRRPKLSDLRESGSLEQDADIVILLHRDEYYNKETRPGEADMIIAKHRNGRTDEIPLLFKGHLSCFRDMPSSSV